MGRMTLQIKVLLWYFLLVVVLMSTIGLLYYNTTSRSLYEIVVSDTLSLLSKNNKIVDQKLSMVNAYANGLMVDEDLSALLGQYEKAQSEYEVFSLDTPITGLLNKYFLYTNDIFSVQLITRRMTYGQMTSANIVPAAGFADSRICTAALAGKGKTVWIPTYHFFQTYGQDYIASENASYQKVFSAVKLVRQFEDDYAILLINFIDDTYADVFAPPESGYQGSYFVVSPEGTLVSHENSAFGGATLDGSWLTTAREQGTGYESMLINGRKYIMCFDTSSVTGWLSGFILDRGLLMSGFLSEIYKNLSLILTILLLIPLFLVLALSYGILKPLNSLQTGIHASGAGNFDVQVRERGFLEIRQLIGRFNQMNARIQQLIRENYEAVLLKKEAELNAYNLQLNPHFILNALSVVNLELLRKGEDDLSDTVVGLSQMMDYTLNTSHSLVPFGEDWAHTKNYLHVMQARYRDRFRFTEEIDPALLSLTVPKFFLQPVVENCILHGFRDISYPARIHVRAYMENGARVFSVTDNGAGIPHQRLVSLEDNPESRIGLYNIRQRIFSLYGEGYGISLHSVPYRETVVEIRLPGGVEGV